MSVPLREFDVANYLDTPRAMAVYLELAFESGDALEVEEALRHVLRAQARRRKSLRRIDLTTPMTLSLLWQAAQSLGLKIALSPRDQCEGPR